MAQYYEDWSGEQLDATNTLSGWTRQYNTANLTYTVRGDNSGYAPAGRALEVVVNSSARSAVTFNGAGTAPEVCEVAALMNFSVVPGPSSLGGPMARASGGAASVTTVAAMLSLLFVTSGKGVQISDYSGGAVSHSAQTPYNWPTGTPFWVILRLVGTSAVVELRGATEPFPLLISMSRTLPTSAKTGLLGLYFFTAGTNVRVLCWCAGTDGDSAPLSGLSLPERQRSRLILTPW